MKQKINWCLVLALSFVIVYVVVKIFLKPNFDHFIGLESLSPEFSSAIENKRYELNQQMLQQYDQDRRINSIKNKVDTLRNDLRIIKSKEEEELRSIYQHINDNDTISQALGVPNQRDKILNTMGRGMESSRLRGKNYNLNLNLDDE